MRVFALIFTFILFFSTAVDAISVTDGKTAPGFTLSSIDNRVISLREYKDKVVLLLYWRTGHERSLLALRDSKDISDKFKKKDVKVISVIADGDSRDEAKKIMADTGIDFPVLVDGNRQVYSAYGIRVYPSTVIIDKKGMVSHSIPSHPLSYKKLLNAYIKKALGELNETEVEEVLSSHKEKKDEASLEAQRLYNLALKFVKSGLHDLAIDTVKKSLKANPGMAESHVLLGFLYLEVKDADNAVKTFNTALKLDPHSNDAKTGIGGALVLKGDADNAIKILKSAAVANPYPQMTYYELGKAYELKGEKDKSMEMFRKAIEKIIKKQILPSYISKCD
jgi:tetratricopeptide (TPR) repeat protein